MQGYILTMEGERNVILGDDGVRYNFVIQDWQGGDAEPGVDMRVQFEARGANAVYVFLAPDASGLPPIQPSTASSNPPWWLVGLAPVVILFVIVVVAMVAVLLSEFGGPVY